MGGKRESMVVFVIWYSLQRVVNRHRFLKYTQILRNPTTSEDCKNFSRGLGYTLWVSRKYTWIMDLKRIYFHDHPMRRSKTFCEKLIFVEKNTVSYTFLDLTFLSIVDPKANSSISNVMLTLLTNVFFSFFFWSSPSGETTSCVAMKIFHIEEVQTVC